MARLGIIKNFKASHGSNKHEHDFKIEIQLEGQIKNDFVEEIDFHDVERIITEEFELLEGKYLNEYLNIRATVENIALYILETLKKRGIKNIYSVKIYEELDRYIEVFDKEIED